MRDYLKIKYVVHQLFLSLVQILQVTMERVTTKKWDKV